MLAPTSCICESCSSSLRYWPGRSGGRSGKGRRGGRRARTTDRIAEARRKQEDGRWAVFIFARRGAHPQTPDVETIRQFASGRERSPPMGRGGKQICFIDTVARCYINRPPRGQRWGTPAIIQSRVKSGVGSDLFELEAHPPDRRRWTASGVRGSSRRRNRSRRIFHQWLDGFARPRGSLDLSMISRDGTAA